MNYLWIFIIYFDNMSISDELAHGISIIPFDMSVSNQLSTNIFKFLFAT